MKVVTDKIRSFFAFIFPANRTELLIFFIALIFYGSFATYIAVNYRIVFDNRIPWDAYFSFDNRAIVMTGGGVERHPLSVYFFDLLRSGALLLSSGINSVGFRVVLALASVLTVSLTVVQLYKYLKQIIGLPDFLACLLLVFFGFSSTAILLSFTPETYTYTLLLLTAFNYYAALKLRAEKETGFAAVSLAGLAVGGLTITNIVKIYIPVIFENGTFKNLRGFMRAAAKVLLSAGLFIFLFLLRMNFDIQKIISKTGAQYEKFSNPKVTPLWDMILSWFFGGNLLFPGFVIRNYHTKTGFQYKAIFMDSYSATLPYLFVGLIVVLMIWSCIVNYRNKLVNILMISFAVDFIIHVVLKFGIHTSYIYGGHFIFVFPLMLGWLLHAYRKSTVVLSILTVILMLSVFYMTLNNAFRIMEFLNFLDRYYR